MTATVLTLWRIVRQHLPFWRCDGCTRWRWVGGTLTGGGDRYVMCYPCSWRVLADVGKLAVNR